MTEFVHIKTFLTLIQFIKISQKYFRGASQKDS